MQFGKQCIHLEQKPMQSVAMSFDDFLTLKALKFKSEISGQSGNAMMEHLLRKNPDAFGMKNMCFRISPVLQAKMEVTLEALGVSKQEALTEMLQEMLFRFDQKLIEVGLGPFSYETRLRELGYELGPDDGNGNQAIISIEPQTKGQGT
jgi:hypothetical protein